MADSREHAVVIGGSLAGLLAARVLADHFARVTLIERDQFPDAAAFRPGLPQARHLHVLWSPGVEIADRLFPGLAGELRAAGAHEIRVPADLLWMTSGGWRRRFDSGWLLTAGRDLLDWTVRSHLAKVDTVQVQAGHEVTGLLADGRAGASGAAGVAGVLVRPRGTPEPGEPLAADLIVDATGRSSRTPGWLEELGFPAVPQTKVDPRLGYASRNYAIPAGFDPGWKALYIQANAPQGTRTGALFPQEGGRWIVSLFGVGEDYPPTDEEGFLNFAASLRSPVLFEAISKAEPLTPIVSFRRTANHRRHYERMRAWPARLIALGDAVCAFNPLYGQGMTVAARSAVVLDDCLSSGSDPGVFARRFHRRVARIASGPWLVATGEDLRYSTTQGASAGLQTRILNRYVSRMIALANVDPRVCARLIDVLSVRSQPTTLFAPDVVWRAATRRVRPPAGPDDLAP